MAAKVGKIEADKIKNAAERGSIMHRIIESIYWTKNTPI